jgi:hypothetical protein
MPTHRTPLRRAQSEHFTDAAVDIFAKMIKVEYWGEQWWKLHGKLWHEFHGLGPWDWPAIEHSDHDNPYPSGKSGHDSFSVGQARWLALEEALEERKNVGRR